MAKTLASQTKEGSCFFSNILLAFKEKASVFSSKRCNKHEETEKTATVCLRNELNNEMT